jgi:predicted nucleic acid-binding protein
MMVSFDTNILVYATLRLSSQQHTGRAISSYAECHFDVGTTKSPQQTC